MVHLLNDYCCMHCLNGIHISINDVCFNSSIKCVHLFVIPFVIYNYYRLQQLIEKNKPIIMDC